MFIGRFEISQNLEYLITQPGFGKILTLVFGLIALGLGGYTYEEKLKIWEEEVYLDLVSLLMAVSFFYLAAHCLLYDLVISRINKIVDLCYHGFGAVSLMIVGILMILSAVDIEHKNCQYTDPYYCDYFDEKLGAGIFSILDSLLFGATGLIVYKATGL